MKDVRFHLTLMRAKIDRLEKLRRLEGRLHLVALVERAAVQGKIDVVMEEIASCNRAIQEYRATYFDVA